MKTRHSSSTFDIYDTIETYKPDETVFSRDDAEMTKIKKIIYTHLDETERRIILAYAELGNIRDTAHLFKVSTTTIWLKIKEIKKKIITLL